MLKVLRTLASLSIHKTLSITVPAPETFPADAPSQGAAPVSPGCPALLPAHPIHSQIRFPGEFSPRFPTAKSEMSHSIKPFIYSAVTQKQPGLVPLRRNPQQRNPWAFIPSQST